MKNKFAIITETKKIKSFNSFLAVRKQVSPTSEIIFSIVNLIDKTNRNNDIYFEINNKLSDFNNDNVQSKWSVRQLSESNISRTTDTDKNRQHTARNDGQVSKKP